ncbi:helix-turn-helix domain-containing protein [Bacillus toyonensis]|uniref:helix-turn-helix domain-containing protein n=1 Tax=Bacillus toyonensis TaxID=155322 RepID=UPI000BF04E35|nr:helix-turn-helix transcriptional regulator [Bacillus toyonensis]PEJ85533.1 transcriptional regulator [Bacillus toyonensis]PEL28039.1 transcriptional regulator [Bacillus toyonensis]PGE82857.1 transcriptional regulator [Bacillus toyonensis]
MPWFKKTRSKLGKFIDKHDLKQVDIAKASGLRESTVSRLANIDSVSPSMKNVNKIVNALRKLSGKNVRKSLILVLIINCHSWKH